MGAQGVFRNNLRVQYLYHNKLELSDRIRISKKLFARSKGVVTPALPGITDLYNSYEVYIYIW